MLRQLGMSLMEMAVGLAVLGAAGAAIMSTTTQGGKTAKTAVLKSEAAQLVEDISNLLGNTDSCTNSLTAMDAASTPGILELKDESGVVVFNTTDSYGGSRLKFSSFELLDKPGLTDGVAVVAGNSGTTNLMIHFAPVRGTAYESRGYSLRTKLSVVTDATGKITTCASVGSSTVSLWQRTPANPDDIFYSVGSVGVGEDDPQRELDVAGWIQARNVDGDVLSIGGTPGAYVLQTSVAEPIVFWNQVRNAYAHIVTGSVWSAGHVYPGDSGAACTATNQGAIRYNRGTQRVQVCESGTWRTKRIVTFCTPPVEIYKGDDEWMRFHQTSNFMPSGRCYPSQISRSNHARLDTTGLRVRFDDRSMSCSNNMNCRNHDPAAQ